MPPPSLSVCGMSLQAARRSSKGAMCQPVVMDYKLELVIIPVTDVDRLKEFY
ncbi:MAG TPA: hypothetical protein VNW50_07210 [Streptosporangiaceae bacterium]|nr:hypothetical protein [Streptosporangiaceae bacterium]